MRLLVRTDQLRTEVHMTRRNVSRAAKRPLGRYRFETDPSWLNWVIGEGAPAPEIPHSSLVIVEDGAEIAKVVVSTVSTAWRFISERAPRGAYSISNVVIIEAGAHQPQLGELNVRLSADGYAVTMTAYKSDGRFQVVLLDGGEYDVKRRSTP